MKEINLNDIGKYIDPFEIKQKPAIALADDGNRINGLTIGWAGFGILWNKLTATVYVHKQRFSKQIFDGADYSPSVISRIKNNSNTSVQYQAGMKIKSGTAGSKSTQKILHRILKTAIWSLYAALWGKVTSMQIQ